LKTSYLGIAAALLLACCDAAVAKDGKSYAGQWDCGEREVLIGSSMYNGEPLDIVEA
jgi:hypothetical protein